MGQQPVLLLESEEGVIKDITCSLRLIDIPVIATISLEEARSKILETKPSLILVRAKIAGETQAAVTLAERIAADDQLDKVPVIVLCTATEKNDITPKLGMFQGELLLPVEFPAFALKVQELLRTALGAQPESSVITTSVTAGQTRPAGVWGWKPGQKAPVTPIAAKSADTAQVADPEIKDRNFSIAYAIQSKVLRELEKDGRLAHAKVEHVPGIVNQVTAKVCVKYASEKFLN